MEDDAGGAHAGRPVDERDLAEPRGALVGRVLRAHELDAGVGRDLDDAPALERDDEPLDDALAQHERAREPDDAVGAAVVGRGEHLLGGEVGHEPGTAHVGETSAGPHVPGDEADREVGARAVVAHGVETEGVERRGASAQLGVARPPGRHRVGLVEAHDDRHLVPEPLDVGLAEHLLGPAGVGRREDRPGDLATGEHLP